jgi:hypothetical protein
MASVLLPAKAKRKRIRGKGLSSLIFLLTLAICGCGGGGGGGNGSNSTKSTPAIDPLTLNYSTYLNAAEQVTVLYPTSWEELPTRSDSDILVTYAEPIARNSSPFPANISVVKTSTIDTSSPDNLKNIKIISKKDFSILGLSAHEEIYDATVTGYEKLNLRFMETGIELNGTIYGLLYAAQRKEFDQNIEIVRHMAKSLNIGQKIFSGIEGTSDFRSPGKPAIATNGENFLVVSCNTSHPTAFATGRIVKPNRAISEEFLITSASDKVIFDGCPLSRFTLTFDGSNYLLTYSASWFEMIDNSHINSGRRIFAQRISISGEVLDKTPIDVSKNLNSSTYDPATISDGSRTLAVWHEFGYKEINVPDHSIKGAFINSDGTVGDSFLIENELQKDFPDLNIYRYTPEVSYGNNQFMIIWAPYFSQDTRRPNTSIYGQLVSPNGSRSLARAVPIRTDNGDNPRYPQIASDGKNYVVGWIEGLLETNLIDSGKFSIYARKISDTGELLNGDSTTLGALVVGPLLVSKNADFVGQQVPRDFLDLSFYNDHYLFLWTSPYYSPESGVYGVKSNVDLSKISQPSPISGTRKDAANSSSFEPRQPNVAHTNQNILVVWPNLPNLEGWHIENKTF